jgi:O-antigen ligase
LNAKPEINKRELYFLIITSILFFAGNIILSLYDLPILPALPFAIVYLLIFLRNYSLFFYFALAALPFSFEIPIGGFTLSTPSEPMMITLLFICLILLFKKNAYDRDFFRHPLIFLLSLHYLVFILNIFFSLNPFLSFKYVLAKTWFIAAFLVFPSIFIRSEKQLKTMFWVLFSALMITVLYTVIRHAADGFAFDKIKRAGQPFYSDHVIYSCTMGIILPFIWFAVSWFKKEPKKAWLIIGSIAVLLFAIGTSYTRTTWIAVLMCVPAYFIFRSRLFKPALVIALVAVTGVCVYLGHNNKFVEFAPDYTKTVFNKDNFEKHLQATYNMEDVSGMERVYRWVAAVNMIKENFWFGTGNNTFYPEYKRYVNPIFVTYLSHNPEHSSTHNYFLMIFSEQGVFGFSFFVILYLAMFLYAYRICRDASSSLIRKLSTACFLSLLVLLIHLVLGDMMEVDKNGSFFFLIIALLIRMDLWNKAAQKKALSSPLTH